MVLWLFPWNPIGSSPMILLTIHSANVWFHLKRDVSQEQQDQVDQPEHLPEISLESFPGGTIS